jgi:hypothetical protein
VKVIAGEALGAETVIANRTPIVMLSLQAGPGVARRPRREPNVRSGPFVLNAKEEIA